MELSAITCPSSATWVSSFPMGAREGLATGLGIALIAYAVIVLIRSALGHRNNSEDTRNSGETVQSKRARH